MIYTKLFFKKHLPFSDSNTMLTNFGQIIPMTTAALTSTNIRKIDNKIHFNLLLGVFIVLGQGFTVTGFC